MGRQPRRLKLKNGQGHQQNGGGKYKNPVTRQSRPFPTRGRCARCRDKPVHRISPRSYRALAFTFDPYPSPRSASTHQEATHLFSIALGKSRTTVTNDRAMVGGRNCEAAGRNLQIFDSSPLVRPLLDE